MEYRDQPPEKITIDIERRDSASPPSRKSYNYRSPQPDKSDKEKERAERKARMSREVRRIRQQNEQEKARKEARRSKLDRLTPRQRQAYIEKWRAEDHAKAQAKKAQAEQRRRDIADLPPEERKAALKEDRFVRKLHRMASPAYIPLQVLKYAIFAALAAGLFYVGIIAYGVFVDNSYAFNNTGSAVSHSRQPQYSSTISEGVDPYSFLLSQADMDFMKERVNILVMGVDNNADRESDWGTGRTDTMLLVSINFESNEASIISLPRDSLVWYYGQNRRGKLNGAFSVGGGFKGGGFECAMNTVSMLLGGIPVNNYVCFDMDVVMDVVDAMGGIDYDVDVAFELDGRTLKEGLQHLDGQQVLDYCRVREKITGGTDIARTARQRKMIMAIFSYMKTNGQLKDIPGIYSAVASNIYTDLTFEQITSLAAFSLKLDSEDLHDYLLPGKYLDHFEGGSFWGINQDKKQEMIYEIFGQTIQFDPNDDVDTLLALRDEKNKAIAAGEAALNTVKSFVSANRGLISADLQTQYEALKKTLEDAMAATKPEDISSTIPPITDATQELLYWFEHKLKPAVEAATPTPTPEPSDSTEPSEPSDSTEPSASATSTATSTPSP